MQTRKVHRKQYHATSHGTGKKQPKTFLKTGQESLNSYQDNSHVVSLPFANVSKSKAEIEAEEEEILNRYGSEDSEEENEAEPGRIINSLRFLFPCL